MRHFAFWGAALVVFVAGALATAAVDNEFYFFAGYAVLQYVIMATAWNILGGFTGYVNFGSAGFFGIGAYTSIALNQTLEPPLFVLILAAAVVCGLLGLATGYLTLRLRGVYFAIATLALAIVLETLIINWEYTGGARGAYIITPAETLFFGDYIEYLFMVMLVLALGSIAVSRYIGASRIGRGLAAIRDEETAAECAGVPTLTLKLVSTTVMGAMMGVAGAPYPFFVTFVDPASAFSLLLAVNSIAMPMIGGIATWFGPVIGALLLGTMQQVVTVTISSELNILILGVTIVAFIILAPKGIVGLVQSLMQRVRA